MTENKFNLIEEKWIPAADRGLVSIRDIFTDTTITALGGDAVQKISVIKLLLAIAQSAWTPVDEQEWNSIGIQSMSRKVLQYLEINYDSFWLYGDNPFLQMPAIEKADRKSFGCVLPMIAYGNSTILNSSQIERTLTDADRALALIQQSSFALGGKKTDNAIVLSPGYTGKTNAEGKPSTGKPGPGLAFMGLLHSFILGSSLIESIWINIFTAEQITKMGIYPEGVGIAPWETMPEGEDDSVARKLKDSYMGRLIPLSRFMLIKQDGIHYSEGILHKSYLEGVVDPSVAVNFNSKKTTVLWADTEKRPWRQLPALLSFMQQSTGSFKCMQLGMTMRRLRHFPLITLWSGGMRVRSNAGEQYLSGTDDFVESEIQLSGAIFGESSVFIETLNQEMEAMDGVSKSLWGRINSYHKDLKVDGKEIANKGTGDYWQLCERLFQELVDTCSTAPDQAKEYRNKYLQFAFIVYDKYCPNQSARQMEAWAANRFGFDQSLRENKKEAKIK